MSGRLPELLCPAGDESALKAAVDCGANAVYLGYKAFGARASAVNFDDEALERAVRYAHLHHVRVHVTVNTLIKPGEMEGVCDALRAISTAGADAVIVQDLGVASLVRRKFPSLQLHASTQMAICNAEGARFAQGMGFDRVVLARECGLEEIRRACQTGIEIETFAHGALCTAVSGRCLMSSMSGGRSGNRGRCAQPCRQCFQLANQDGPLLSMRDLCLLDDLPALCETGVASLKIEGRLKSAEYVAVVTDVYRRALDAVANGNFRSSEQEKEKLMQIFNRGGFTRGHAMGAQDASLITPERVSHEGLMIGHIVSVRRELAALHLTRDLNDGDSLQLRGRKDEDMRYSGPKVPAGGTATLRLRPGLKAEPGMAVARLTDAVQLESARAHAPRPIPVHMLAHFELDRPMSLSLSDGENSVTVYGPVTESAQKRASTVSDVRRQLEKMGGTPFELSSEVQVFMQDNLFLPVGVLNALRREAVDKLIEARIDAFSLPASHRNQPLSVVRPVSPAISSDTLAVLFSNPRMAVAFAEAGASMLIFEPRSFGAEALASVIPALSKGTWLRLPPQLPQQLLEDVCRVIRSYSDHLGGIVAESAGQLDLNLPLPMLAGEGIPLVNPDGLKTILCKNISGFTLWPEWTFNDHKGLFPASLPSLLKMYGRERLMLLNHCPERVRLGLDANRSSCRICKTEGHVCGQENAGYQLRKDLNRQGSHLPQHQVLHHGIPPK